MADIGPLAKATFASLLLCACGALEAGAETRHALVIGNSAYQSVAALRNPVNDAKLVSERLASVGFSVSTLTDATLPKIREALNAFAEKLSSNKDAVGLFYFAGHGVQVRGENYLLPVDALLNDDATLFTQTINANEVLRVMDATSSRLNIVILDACRNNPFASNLRSASRGLARMEGRRGSFVAFATAPGDIAFDGDGANSPYTLALADALIEPGRNIDEVFKRARREVIAATSQKQIPWDLSSITSDFFFRAGSKGSPIVSEPSRPIRELPTKPPLGRNEKCFVFNGKNVCE